MVEEYVEFFKNKKKIRQEWAIHSAETQKRIDKYIDMLKCYDANINSLNTVLPILVELACLVSKFNHEDIETRQKLSQKLRLTGLPNNGYLRTDTTYNFIGNKKGGKATET